jgi:aminoglycoside phosphotransferase (APT) family kinase protein
MPDKPAAELTIDAELVRALLEQVESQPEAVGIDTRAPLAHVADGWDCSVWRLGAGFAVRVPRRELGAPLVLNEQAHLAPIAERVAATGVGIPAPVFAGRPSGAFPWAWSIVPWFDGEPGIRVPRTDRSGWADDLGAVLRAIHVPATSSFPLNPVRGVPLARRDGAARTRLAALRTEGRHPATALDRLEELWQEGLDAAPRTGTPVWIHGDLHPGNVIARGGRLTALIDFGDMTAGDPAYDLAIAWLAFDADGRGRFRDALAGSYDEATWTRARAWAAADTLVFLSSTDDDPEYAAFGVEALAELTSA